MSILQYLQYSVSICYAYCSYNSKSKMDHTTNLSFALQKSAKHIQATFSLELYTELFTLHWRWWKVLIHSVQSFLQRGSSNLEALQLPLKWMLWRRFHSQRTPGFNLVFRFSTNLVENMVAITLWYATAAKMLYFLPDVQSGFKHSISFRTH